MPELNLDFSDVKQLTEGWHSARIFNVEGPVMSSNDNPMLNLQYKIEGGPFGGRSLYENWMLGTDAVFRTKSNLVKLGFMTKDETGLKIDTEDLIGTECEIKVAFQEYEGEDRPRVTGLRAPTGDTLEALA